MKIIILILIVMFSNTLAYAALSAGNVPKVKSGGAIFEDLQNSNISEDSNGNVKIGTMTANGLGYDIDMLTIAGRLSAAGIDMNASSLLNFQFDTPTINNLWLFKNAAQIALEIGHTDANGTTNVQTMVPLILNPPTVLSGTAPMTRNSGLVFRSRYTGTITGPLEAMNVQIVSDVKNTYNNVGLRIGLDNGPNTNTSLYTIDSTSVCNSTPPNPIECHAGRFTAFSGVNMGGTQGTPASMVIGSKSASVITGTNTFHALNMANEVVAYNTDPTTQDECGVCIAAGGTAGTTRNDDGIMFNAAYGGNGYFTKYLINLMGLGLGITLAPTGTAIGAAGSMTITNGIDLSNLTMTGNAYRDQYNVITGTGNIGIGTMNPAAPLEIMKRNVGQLTGLIVRNKDTTNNSTADIDFSVFYGTPTPNSRIGAIRTNSPSVADAELAFHTRGAGVLTEKMRITSTGNVGIGTTSPNATLDLGASKTPLYMQGLKAKTGTLFLCIDTAGKVISQPVACSGS